MDRFLEIANDPIRYLKEELDGSDRKLAVTFSGIFPLELLDAMGFRAVWLPPILQSQYKQADSMVQVFMCSRARSFVDVVAGHVLPVAAIGAVIDCDAKDVIPGVLKSGGYDIPVSTLRVPISMEGSLAMDFAVNSVRQWVQEAPAVFNRTFDFELLARSCVIRSKVRSKITELFQGIGTDVDPVFAYSAAVSSQVMGPEAFLNALNARPWPKPDERKGVPIILSGSELPHINIVRDLTTLGANILLDDTETGVRAASRPECQAQNEGDKIDTDRMLEAIGAGMIFQKHGPTKVTTAGTRLQGLVSSSMNRGVKVAILGLFKFCDPHAFEAPSIIEQFRMAGIRTLVIEVDKEKGLSAREKTRVQTLLESME